MQRKTSLREKEEGSEKSTNTKRFAIRLSSSFEEKHFPRSCGSLRSVNVNHHREETSVSSAAKWCTRCNPRRECSNKIIGTTTWTKVVVVFFIRRHRLSGRNSVYFPSLMNSRSLEPDSNRVNVGCVKTQPTQVTVSGRNPECCGSRPDQIPA